MTEETTENTPQLGDNAIAHADQDWLGFGEYVPGLRRVIENADTPFVVGVHGDWGSGKTSLMRLLQEEMDRTGHITVWFNPWKYHERGEVWKALIRVTYTEVRAALTFLQFGKRHVGDTLRAGARQALNMAGRLAGTGETGDEIEAVLTLDKAFVNSFEDEFSRLLGQLFEVQREARSGEEAEGPATEPRLVIFVDDLDRCCHEAVMEVLEALKLYLDVDRCVFVLGVNRESVRDAVFHHYQAGKADGQPSMDPDHYLEKIVQLPFHVPAADKTRMTEFLKKLGVRERAPEGVDADTWTEYVEQVAETHANNPRQIKRYLLTVELADSVAPPRIPRLSLAKMVMLQFIAPSDFEVIQRYPQVLLDWQTEAAGTEAEEKTQEDEAPDRAGLAMFGKEYEMSEAHAQRASRLASNPLLTRVLRMDPRWEDLDEIVRCLRYSGGRRAAQSPGSHADFEQLQADLLSPDVSVVQSAIKEVRDQGEDAVQAHVRGLIAKLTDSSDEERWRASITLGYIGEPAAVPPLLDALEHGDREMRFHASHVLAHIGSRAAVEGLTAALSQRNAPARRCALGALAEIRGDETDSKLLSQDLDGALPWLDPQEPITLDRVVHVAHVLKIPQDEVHRRYEDLAGRYPLKLAWRD